MSNEKFSYSSAPGSISLIANGGITQVVGGDYVPSARSDTPWAVAGPDSWMAINSTGGNLSVTVTGTADLSAESAGLTFGLTSSNETIDLVGKSNLFVDQQMTFGSLTVNGAGTLNGMLFSDGSNVTLNASLDSPGKTLSIYAGSSPLNAAGDVIANSVVHINGAADANTVIYMDGTNAPSMGLPAPEVLVAHPGEFHAVTTFSGSGAPGVLGLLGAVASSYNIKADLTNPSVLDLDLYGPKGGLLDTVTLQDTIMDQHVYVAQCALGVYVSTNTADLEMGGSMHLLSVHS